MIITPADILAWVELSPKKYYKDGKLYGLVGTIRGKDDVLYIASMTVSIEEPFTKSMLRDIIKLYKKNTICLITDVKEKQELIRDTLKRYNFTYSYKNNIMYSKGGMKCQQ